MNKQYTEKKVRKIIRSMPVTKGLMKGFEANGWQTGLKDVCIRAAALLQENAHLSAHRMTHMRQLLPMIAFYETAARITGSQKAALAFFEEWAFGEAKKMVRMIRPFMKLGLYRLMPAMCGWMLDRMFGEKAGFTYREVPGGKKFSVDMTSCPYVETCAKYGCPELTQFACRADDVTYGHLHPKLVWARTQTLGMGGECCDFRLHLKED